MKNSILKEIRDSFGFVQKQMGTILDVSQQQYSKFERNIDEMKESHIIRLSEKLDVSPTWLLLQIGPKKISDFHRIRNEDEQIESHIYAIKYFVEETMESIKDWHQDHERMAPIINAGMIENILIENMKILENTHIFFFCVILSKIPNGSEVKSTYHEFLVSQIKAYKTDVFYRDEHKEALLDMVKNFNEISCKYIIKNREVSIEKSHLNLDITTRFVNNFFPISNVQNILKKSFWNVS